MVSFGGAASGGGYWRNDLMAKMNSTTDSAPVPDTGLVSRLSDLFMRMFQFAVGGAVVGAILGHFLVHTEYLSRGYLLVSTPATQGTTRPAAVHQPLTTSIVAAALDAARKGSPNLSLPSSPENALDHASIDFGQSNDVVAISYRCYDPDVAGCMAGQIVTAYVNALASGIAGPPPTVTLKLAPIVGHPDSNMSLAVMYPIVGAGLGVAICLAMALIRMARP